MGDETKGATGSIDELLKSRAQFQAWLSKLEQADDQTPPHVRTRVHADYTGRLEAVLVQLRQHAGAVATSLAAQQTTLSALETRDADVAEQIAEAQLRYTVGEYSEEAWEAMAAEARAKRTQLSDEIDAARGEIARLVEVQSIILEGPPAAPEAQHVPEPIAPPMLDIAPAVIAAAAVPAAPAPVVVPPVAATVAAPKPALPPLDELDFLKSVTEETSPSRPRAATATVAAPQAAPPQAPGAPAPKGKMLKCQECGTENKPTEWYCERCGAELTDL